jgi:hypothetical protein
METAICAALTVLVAWELAEAGGPFARALDVCPANDAASIDEKLARELRELLLGLADPPLSAGTRRSCRAF